MLTRILNAITACSGVIVLSACHALPPVLPTGPGSTALTPFSIPPYPQSKLITAVQWHWRHAPARLAIGSDLWPCTWASDGNQYCAWGDGGGFDGNDDQIGRASLGFARLSGFPRGNGTRGFEGRNVWGTSPYALSAASFGGKVNSMVSAGGILYAVGAFWTSDATAAPTRKSGAGPFQSLAWSQDLGSSWQLASWSGPPLGNFLNAGEDNAAAPEHYVYLYYQRSGDATHLYLKRIEAQRLPLDPNLPGTYTYLAAEPASAAGGFAAAPPSWSADEGQASAVFTDSNRVDTPQVVFNAPLRRYLMCAGHYASGNYANASVGSFGVFESRTPWGPWSTVAYYDDWGGYAAISKGDFLGMQIAPMWQSRSGKQAWFVFSGLHELDAFNLIKATFRVRKSAL